MVDLSKLDKEELKQRLDVVHAELGKIFDEIGPKVEKIGLLRTEAGLLTSEIIARDGKKNG